jgi:hypothetical protein
LQEANREMSRTPDLNQIFDQTDQRIVVLERALRDGEALPVAETVAQALDLVKGLLRAYAAGKNEDPVAAESLQNDDLLEVFKGFVKGDPSLNAVRDNVRELVYYRNCLEMNRQDALPAKPAAMAVHTVRHIYLYLRTRALKEQRIDAD